MPRPLPFRQWIFLRPLRRTLRSVSPPFGSPDPVRNYLAVTFSRRDRGVSCRTTVPNPATRRACRPFAWRTGAFAGLAGKRVTRLWSGYRKRISFASVPAVRTWRPPERPSAAESGAISRTSALAAVLVPAFADVRQNTSSHTFRQMTAPFPGTSRYGDPLPQSSPQILLTRLPAPLPHGELGSALDGVCWRPADPHPPARASSDRRLAPSPPERDASGTPCPGRGRPRMRSSPTFPPGSYLKRFSTGPACTAGFQP
jgi:hypothetical protein